MDWKKYLKTLGIEVEGAETKLPSTSELKKQWKKKVKETHPDTGGDPAEFKAVMHAYKMLTDTEYVYRHKKSGQPEPAEKEYNIHFAVDFETAFFGKTINISFNRVTCDENGKLAAMKDDEELEVVTINFDIPPGVMTGHRIRKEKKGHRWPHGIQDAVIVIQVLPHAKFTIDKIGNIHSTEMVPLDKMLKGLDIEVLTMYGLETVRLKPGTVPDDEYKIPMRGLNKIKDHIVKIQPQFPKANDLKSDDWKGLDINWEEPEIDPEDEFMKKSYALFLELSNEEDDNPFDEE